MSTLTTVLRSFMLVLASSVMLHAEITQITPDVARDMALKGEVILVDVRRPDEWTATGVPDVALLADMTQRNFLDKLQAIRAQSPNIPWAFICHSGNRSAYVSQQLEKFGWSGIYDVVGGVSGSDVDAGWIGRGLPVRGINDPVNPVVAITQP